jgi:Putative DNA-binding domain
MTLLALQRDMRTWLTTGTQSAAARFEPSALTGLGVYQNTYRAQLVACLEETFQRVKTWLGEDEFLAAAAQQIETSPPSDWTLDRYGRDFPQTLRARYPQDPEVAELAWLDRALADTFAGPDVEPASLRSLATIDWDRAVLQLTPTLIVGQVLTNSPAIWSALSAEHMPPVVATLSKPAAVLVWRNGFTPCLRTLDSTEERALAHTRSAGTFGALCAMFVATVGDSEAAKAAGELLAQWLRDGLIVAVRDAAIDGARVLSYVNHRTLD